MGGRLGRACLHPPPPMGKGMWGGVVVGHGGEGQALKVVLLLQSSSPSRSHRGWGGSVWGSRGRMLGWGGGKGGGKVGARVGSVLLPPQQQGEEGQEGETPTMGKASLSPLQQAGTG